MSKGRFTLLSLFGVVTFAAVGCGIDSDRARRAVAEKQLPAIRAGEEHTLYHPLPGMLSEFARDADIAANVEEVFISDDASSIEFAALADFPQLTSVAIYDATGTDALLKHLLGCDKIAKLSIDQSDLSDEGLATISRMTSLEDLQLAAPPGRLSTAGLNKLIALRHLKTLELYLGPPHPEVQTLRSALPDCRIELLKNER